MVNEIGTTQGKRVRKGGALPLAERLKIPSALLDEAEVSALTGYSLSTIRQERLRKSSEFIPFVRINGWTCRYRVRDVMAWLEAQTAIGGDDKTQYAGARRGRPSKRELAAKGAA